MDINSNPSADVAGCVRHLKSLPWLLVLIVTLTACEPFPRDPQGSLDKILERGNLRVGVIYSPPWIVDDSLPAGLEVDLIEEFARGLRVEPLWVTGSAEAHFKALEAYELDVVIGGISTSSPWRQRVAFTIPYFREETGVGFAPGELLPEKLSGLTVTAPTGSGLASVLTDHGAMVIFSETAAAASPPVAAPIWQLERLGLNVSSVRLTTVLHVMAIPAGENGLLMALEDYLLASADGERIDTLLKEY